MKFIDNHSRDESGLSLWDYEQIRVAGDQYNRELWRRLLIVCFTGGEDKTEGRSEETSRLVFVFGLVVALVAAAIGRRRPCPRNALRFGVELAYINAGSDYWGEAIGDTLRVDICRCRAWIDGV